MMETIDFNFFLNPIQFHVLYVCMLPDTEHINYEILFTYH